MRKTVIKIEREGFAAFDNTTFENEQACMEYERANFDRHLVGLTHDQVKAAISREDVSLANSIEWAGSVIAKARRDAGELRRKPNSKPDETKVDGSQGADPAAAGEAAATHHSNHATHAA